MTDHAIEVRDLHRRTGRFALEGVDLVLPTGYVMGLVGPNGAGKTTTIKTALGMISPDSGRTELLGRPAGDPTVRQRVGVVLDEPLLAPEWSVATAGRRLGRFYRTWDSDHFEQLLERFAVPTTHRVSQLSRGQGMKLSLALALGHRPELLVLDEPTSGLDPASRSDVVDVLRDFMTEDGRSILFSTHITTDLEGLADHLQVMSGGRVVFTGTLDALGEEFAMVRGSGTPDAAAAAALFGARDLPGGFEGLIRLADTSLFDAAAVVEEASIDDVVVRLTRDTAPGHRPAPAGTDHERTSA